MACSLPASSLHSNILSEIVTYRLSKNRDPSSCAPPASSLSCLIFLHFSICYMYLIYATYILTRDIYILIVISVHKNVSSTTFCLFHAFPWERHEVLVEWMNELERLQVWWRGSCLMGDEAGSTGHSWRGRQGVGQVGPYRPPARDFGVCPNRHWSILVRKMTWSTYTFQDHSHC